MTKVDKIKNQALIKTIKLLFARLTNKASKPKQFNLLDMKNIACGVGIAGLVIIGMDDIRVLGFMFLLVWAGS